jgi:hypothetical protein
MLLHPSKLTVKPGREASPLAIASKFVASTCKAAPYRRFLPTPDDAMYHHQATTTPY